MFAVALFIALAIVGIATLIGLVGVGVWMIRDSDGEWAPRLMGGGLLLGALCLVLGVAAVATGQLNLGDDVPDGCYYVSNEIRVLPAGKTVITYNDREYFPIPCPGGM